eukprot:TRINITY_DN6755_c0_g1_i2.p1 TRINITY_DN6755_c0_g1~~TRINITY_DN6755_c0_g1_i2.p1  ORF type:complete len:142 (-),score=29.48 TRINITY_DN6755_c0_g1_i2:74-499(-)
MGPRLVGELTSKKFDVVVLLAGTNDLGSRKASDIIADLADLHTKIIDSGAHLLAVTIPLLQFDTFKALTEKRTIVNDWIRENSIQASVLDLENLFPKGGDDESDEYWDDGLHFSPKGYDYFGKLVFEALQPVFQKLTESCE